MKKRSKLRFSRVLLINLPGVEQSGYRPSPLGILYLAAYLKRYSKGITVDVIDGAMEGEKALFEKIKEFKPDLIGMSVLTPSRLTSIKIAAFTKTVHPKCKVVLGSVHPTLMWKQMMEAYPMIDFIVKGEGEETLKDLVAGKPLSLTLGLVWRKGDKIINNAERPLIKNINKLPFPAWDLINPQRYPPRGTGIIDGINLETEVRYPLIFSRGCMAACTFCSTWRIWRGYRFRTGKNVADEIEMLYKRYQARHFCFQDDTLTGSRKEIMNLCHEIIKRKLNIAIFGTTRVDHVDEELLKLMRKAGFYLLSYGIESGSHRMLLRINKRTDLNKIISATRLTKKAKIRVCALMMYGLPGETDEDRRLSEKLIEKIKPDEVGTVGAVWVFPGTALYERAKMAKLIDDSFWLGKRHYYIYRGGIDGDPINRQLLFMDWYNFYIKDSLSGRILFNPLLFLKRKYFNVWLYHLKLFLKV